MQKNRIVTGLLVTVSLMAVSQAFAQEQSSTTLAPITLKSDGQAQDDGKVVKRARTGTKTATPIIETSQSTSVVTAEQAEKQGATSVSTALRYEPGVTTGSRLATGSTASSSAVSAASAAMPTMCITGMACACRPASTTMCRPSIPSSSTRSRSCAARPRFFTVPAIRAASSIW